jgi:hypothetical protein
MSISITFPIYLFFNLFEDNYLLFPSLGTDRLFYLGGLFKELATFLILISVCLGSYAISLDNYLGGGSLLCGKSAN